ncbi:EAL domain-containing protein [Roseofilum capinflatum]|uniref:EAL domain-containing protein n=1 Tax=Roseofilum capinflatum BLCC-M114 TaxID=3022440 RepID=A0ABT7B7Y3_9CYAN|nr:EAL domain-containing protein [Roseofilum capinflatum]MDJ1175291.1 EAL domain-containing protein [Roseofilum capinflatum BLCC-M114]
MRPPQYHFHQIRVALTAFGVWSCFLLFGLVFTPLEGFSSLRLQEIYPLISILLALMLVSYWGGFNVGLGSALLVNAILVYHGFIPGDRPFFPHTPLELGLSGFLMFSIALLIGHTQDRNKILIQKLKNTQNSLDKSLDRLTSFNLLLQELLRESHVYYQSLADVLPQMIYRVDCEGKLTFANQAFLSLISKNWSEVIGQSLDQIYPLELAQKMMGEDRWVQETGNVLDRVDYQSFLPSDRPRYFHAIKTPIYNAHGDIIGTQSVSLDITERETILEALQKSQKRYELATQAGRVGIWEWDLLENKLKLDGSLQKLLGYDKEENNTHLEDWSERIYSEDKRSLFKQVNRAVKGEIENYEITQRLVHKNGQICWFLLRGTVQKDEQNQRVRLMGTGTDITELKETEAALIKAEKKYHSIFENAIEGIFQTTLEGEIISVNPAFAKILGYDCAESLMETVDNVQTQLYVHPPQRDDLIALIEKNGEILGFEYQVYRSDGSQIWISENCHSVRDPEGYLLYLEGTIEDITERKKAQDILEHHAFHDPLTGLFNRSALMEKIESCLSQVREQPGRFFTVLMIDLNRFKIINDSLGHFVGDQLLISVARRLESYIANCGIVARLNGDDFAVLIPDIQNYDEIMDLADCMEEAFINEPFWVQGHEVFMSASIGIVLSHHASTGLVYEDAEQLLKDADTAIYHAKRKGKNHHQLFDSTMRPVDECQFQLEMDLRRAIDRQEFCLYYQPIVSLHTGTITGFEALVRWKTEENRVISPGKFIPLAEVTGLIVTIGEWVIEEACRQIREWQTDGLWLDSLYVNVNVAGRQFSQAGLVERIYQSLQCYGLSPESFQVEITEGLMMEQMESVIDQLRQLQALGVHLCIDDFGTGHSSLSRLQLFPINTLKIDQSFIPLKTEVEKDWELVKSIVNLGHSLSMRVVAEGVETMEQQQKLQELGCDYGQGYWFAKPLEQEAVRELLRQNPVW